MSRARSNTRDLHMKERESGEKNELKNNGYKLPNVVKDLTDFTNATSSENPKQNKCEENHARHISQADENQKKKKILKLASDVSAEIDFHTKSNTKGTFHNDNRVSASGRCNNHKSVCT